MFVLKNIFMSRPTFHRIYVCIDLKTTHKIMMNCFVRIFKNYYYLIFGLPAHHGRGPAVVLDRPQLLPHQHQIAFVLDVFPRRDLQLPVQIRHVAPQQTQFGVQLFVILQDHRRIQRTLHLKQFRFQLADGTRQPLHRQVVVFLRAGGGRGGRRRRRLGLIRHVSGSHLFDFQSGKSGRRIDIRCKIKATGNDFLRIFF